MLLSRAAEASVKEVGKSAMTRKRYGSAISPAA